MKRSYLVICLFLIVVLFSAVNVEAIVYIEDFSGDLSNWTAGPSHIDSYGIVGGELFMNGQGHLTGSGGWGVLQYNPVLGPSFTATWDARITAYDYANFALFADPYGFNSGLGYATDGYISWLDINDPTLPQLDLMGIASSSGFDLAGGGARNVSLSGDIANNEWHNWKVEKSGSVLKVYINDILYINSSDSTFADSNFKFGLSFGEDSEGYFDNLRIETPDVIPEPLSILLLGAGLAGAFFRKRFIS